MSVTATRVRRPPGADAIERPILVRVDRAIRVEERELRYQLACKDQHPLAEKAELLDVLAELEDRGLVESELCFRLTPAGRDCLAALGGKEGRAS